MKILVLSAEIMGYTESLYEEISSEGNELFVIHWDKKKLTTFILNKKSSFKKKGRSKFNLISLIRLCIKFNPKVVIVSGWTDKFYLPVCFLLKILGKKIICTLDTQYQRSFKHFFVSILGKLNLFKIFYTNIWVPGIYQYEFARKMGYKKDEIILNLLSADTKLLDNYKIDLKKNFDFKLIKFLFVGRFAPEKGLSTLLRSWAEFQKLEISSNCQLILVGNGKIPSQFINLKNIKILNFLQPKDLFKLAHDTNCFILPSESEPWGVVLHEFAYLGIPIIASDAVGSIPYFLIDEYNGYLFKKSNSNDLLNKIIKFTKLSKKEILNMSFASQNLGSRINTKQSAKSLLSKIKNL